jgi:RES domain
LVVTPPRSPLSWQPSYRIVPSRFPPIQLFERVAANEDLDAVMAVESLTNPRLRMELGALELVPKQDRVSGPGTAAIMAPFVYLNPTGSRFSDGSYGVYYAANRLDTAIAETVFHREAFLAATREPPMQLDMRVYLADVAAELHDLRALSVELAAIYDPDNYLAAQDLARRLRATGTEGFVYRSVRDADGECVALMRPKSLSRCRQAQHLCYVWNGERIWQVYEKSELRAV